MEMDPNGQHRSRENETPSQRHKREKAAERQRRKRERDRQAGLQNILALSQQQVQQVPPPPIEVPPSPAQQMQELPQPMPEYKGEDLSPEEVAKRDRIRAAARERQRKHRALVKARKLRELGLDMGNDIMPALDEYGRMSVEGQYPPVMPHDLPPHPHQQPHPIHEPPFPQGQPLGGQTFASTLLLSFSCAPLLKQHLLRTLSMTNEELASLEPIIAQAWDHWDQQRRMHYAQAQHVQKAPDEAPPLPDPNAHFNAMAEHPAYVHDPAQANDFRARFHRPLVAPSPFRSSIVPGSAPQESAPQPQMSASAPPAPVVNGTEPVSANPPTIDPQLGQARDEAAGVAGKLERS
ncbi:hypothetical protein OH76DRAFT_1403441 [Lentinus brumalis]|uniref:Uncharacterized protein n=1 Tax=Lentinus brumalis TaxID=2498619 RepID=A0A371DBB1_9APHY|nr:hypothetical protein OH76DRAFT_1403441 [Polyporus brumalis]